MPDHAPAHPLDSDLLDYVEGSLGEAESLAVEDHLASCILCRIKRQRLTNLPPADLTAIHDLGLPTFTPIRCEQLDGSAATRGDLWTTRSDDSAIVLIRSVREHDWGVVVVPVILDVEIADASALVLDVTASPLETPIAVFERMTISLPLSALAARVVPARPGVDLWALTASDPGVTRGSALEGATDPRVEVRQYLADRLVALDPHEAGEPAGGDDSNESGSGESVDAIFEELVRGFYGKPTEPEHVTLEHGATGPQSWRSIARITKFNQAVLLFDTANGLEDEDRRLAASLCDELHGSAVAIMAGSDRDRTDIYPRSHLVGETDTDSGEVVTGPLITGPMVDVIARYLDHLTEIPQDASGQQSSTKHLADPKEILASKVADALSEQVATGEAATTPSKQAGYKSVADDTDALTAILRTAFSAELDLQAIRDLSGLEEQE